MITINQSSVSWQDELYLLNEMTSSGSINPSQIAGNDTDPMDDIIAELQKANPDWNKISADLDRAQSLCEVMIDEAKGLKGTTAADLRTQLNNVLLTIENLKNVIKFSGGKSEFIPLFQSLGNFFTEIKQDILQGIVSK